METSKRETSPQKVSTESSLPSESSTKTFTDLKFKRKPWSHQLAAIEKAGQAFSLGKNYFALFMEVGTGKTLAMVNIFRLLCMGEGAVPRTLILSPLITLHNWKKEILENSYLKEDEIQVLTGTGKNKAQAILESGARICIGNYEMLYSKDVEAALALWMPKVLICDESHKLKDGASKRTKAVLRLSEKAKYKFIMTGTPVLKNLMDLWSQAKILDGGQRLFTSFFAFRGRYFINKNTGSTFKNWPDWHPVKDAEKEIGYRLADISHQAKKSECLDLPPFVRVPIKTELTREQLKHYLLMEHDLITFIKDEASTAAIALTKALRLQQIVSGFIKTDDGNEIEFKDTPREAALEGLLDTLCPDNKVIVWSVFKNNYKVIRRVCEKLGLKYVELTGEISNKDKFSNVDLFNNDPTVSVLIGAPQAGGVGINLVSANCSIYYSRGFSLEADLQSEARNFRGGSEIHSKVTRYDIISEGTIDEEVINALEAKEEIGIKTLKAMIEKRL